MSFKAKYNRNFLALFFKNKDISIYNILLIYKIEIISAFNF